MKTVFFGIHPDDIELGCGGTVALAARERHEVVLVDLSDGGSSSNGTVAERAEEAHKAAEILGAAERLNLGFPDARIMSEDDKQTADLVACIRGLKPDIAFIPEKDDPHPDHNAGGKLIERALYLAGVQGYLKNVEAWKVPAIFVYMCRLEFTPHFIVDVSSTHELKMEAVLAHRSQFVLEGDRSPTRLNQSGFLGMLSARARVYGGKIGVEFGEPFKLFHPLAVREIAVLAQPGERGG